MDGGPEVGEEQEEEEEEEALCVNAPPISASAPTKHLPPMNTGAPPPLSQALSQAAERFPESTPTIAASPPPTRGGRVVPIPFENEEEEGEEEEEEEEGKEEEEEEEESTGSPTGP